jgi:hypothetical protein
MMNEKNAVIKSTQVSFSLPNGSTPVMDMAVIVFLCPHCDNVHIHMINVLTNMQCSLSLTALEAEAVSKQLLDPQLAKPEDFV